MIGEFGQPPTRRHAAMSDWATRMNATFGEMMMADRLERKAALDVRIRPGVSSFMIRNAEACGIGFGRWATSTS